MQNLVRFGVALTADSWRRIGGTNSDSWVLLEEERKPRSSRRAGGKSTQHEAEQRSEAETAPSSMDGESAALGCAEESSKVDAAMRMMVVAKAPDVIVLVAEERVTLRSPQRDFSDGKRDWRGLEMRERL